MNLIEFMERSNVLGARQDLSNCFFSFINNLGFEYFTFSELSFLSISEKNEHFNLLSNYPEKWLKYYKSRNYALHDPVYAAAHRIRCPATWKEMSAVYADKSGKVIMQEAAENSLVTGIGIPLYSNSGKMYGLSLAASHTDVNFDKNFRSIYNAAAVQLLLVYENLYGRMTEPDITLTAREVEILEWIAAGKTKQETACILCISQSCVKRHCENIFCKLRVSTLPSAVAVAIRLHYI
jgi:LuxR family transcriptional regulator, transcriptional activator of the bioluminescence operon